MTEHWSWLTGAGAEYTYSPPSRPSRPPHRPLVKLATSARLSTIARAYIKENQKIKSIHNTKLRLDRIMKGKTFMLCLFLLTGRRVESSQEIMKTLTINFTKALDVCKTEMDLPDTINADFLNFWKEGYELLNPMTGCAIICLSTKLSLMEPEGKLQPKNTQNFATKYGADETIAKQLVDLLRQCEIAAPVSDDSCLKVLGVVKCFKAEIHHLDWAPDMELVMGEFLAKI